MVMFGCQGKANSLTIEEKPCPRCGHMIEIFSVDTEMQCEKCGFTIYNDKLSCVQWCEHAVSCVGEEAYRQLMLVAEAQKEREKERRQAKAAC